MSLEDSLLKLNELKEKGALTEEEFSKRKAELLAGASEKPKTKNVWWKILAGLFGIFSMYLGLSTIQHTKSTPESNLPACDSNKAISTLREAYNQSQFARTLNLSVIDISKPTESSHQKTEKRVCSAKITLNNTSEVPVEYSMEAKEGGKFMLIFKQLETSQKNENNVSSEKAQNDAESPDDILIEALTPNKEKTERRAESGKAIQAHINNGIIDKKPNQRSDYTDHYAIRKSSTFLGYELIAIEEEYMTDYIGCCVSPGMGLVLKINESAEKLKKFAEENGCSVAENIAPATIEQELGVRLNLAPGVYASLSCRERDLSQTQ